jgi:dephospho-CoA kinase
MIGSLGIMKRLFLLLGSKGAGKSYISELMEKNFGIKFFRVEDIWLKIEEKGLAKKEKVSLGRREIINDLRRLFKSYDLISIESTGTSEGFFDFVQKLKNAYSVQIIKVKADFDVCEGRIMKRDATRHVAYTKKQLEEIHESTERMVYHSDLEIDNTDSTEGELIKQLQEHMKQSKIIIDRY